MGNRESLTQWLCQVGVPEDMVLEPVGGGGNNRVFRIRAEKDFWLLKEYFHHPRDTRNRLRAEYEFLSYAWDRGVRMVPRPLACQEEEHRALYEFVSGRDFSGVTVGLEAVSQAAEFFRQLNMPRPDQTSRNLSDGSEACFTLEAHLQCVEGRIQRLDRIEEISSEDRAARIFVGQSLKPCWEKICGQVMSECGGVLDRQLSHDERCISPSDFGFHNALQRADGAICFLDFEYAGWDDPAKTICDFFCQVKVPVPKEFSPHMVDSVAAWTGDASFFRRRVEWLMPVYGIKWCCIVLNEFLSVGLQRREFAGGSQAERKGRQLEMAKEMLSKIELSLM